MAPDYFVTSREYGNAVHDTWMPSDMIPQQLTNIRRVTSICHRGRQTLFSQYKKNQLIEIFGIINYDHHVNKKLRIYEVVARLSKCHERRNSYRGICI